jgi:hypothetical protein
MATISSKIEKFSIKDNITAQLAAFLGAGFSDYTDEATELDIADAYVEVEIRLCTDKPIRNSVYKDMLRSAVEKDAQGRSLYINAENRAIFDFQAGKYVWNDKEIYITPREALALFNYCVSSVVDTSPEAMKHVAQAMYRMRSRFGADFPGALP